MFTLADLEKSETAKKMGLNNKIPQELIDEAQLLLEHLNGTAKLILDNFGYKIKVTSGYRSGQLNYAVGGNTSSQHMKCQAYDFTIVDVGDGKQPSKLPLSSARRLENIALFIFLTKNIKYDQIILYERACFIHISQKTDGSSNRGQVFINP